VEVASDVCGSAQNQGRRPAHLRYQASCTIHVESLCGGAQRVVVSHMYTLMNLSAAACFSKGNDVSARQARQFLWVLFSGASWPRSEAPIHTRHESSSAVFDPFDSGPAKDEPPSRSTPVLLGPFSPSGPPPQAALARPRFNASDLFLLWRFASITV
jgi:hypothetical protein